MCRPIAQAAPLLLVICEALRHPQLDELCLVAVTTSWVTLIVAHSMATMEMATMMNGEVNKLLGMTA
ncbi:MAG: hypothetical protein SGPRY_011367 [Prymnesium sp.]